VDLFGHASLAALHVLFSELQTSAPEVVLSTRTGPFVGRREGRQLVIELPRHEVVAAEPESIERALGHVQQAWTTEAGDVVALLDSFDALCALDPDTVELFLVPASLVIAVAEGGIDSDLAIRVFAPRLGVREDAATGPRDVRPGADLARPLGRGAPLGPPDLHPRRGARRSPL